MRARGANILSMVPWITHKNTRPHTGHLNTNLLEVFLHARQYPVKTRTLVDTWEIANEPDTAFIPAMPDQYAAWAKAVYLGLKTSSHSPAVLNGGFGLPPGNYLKHMKNNDLFAYTDAFNQHYYGRVRDFSPMMELIRHHLNEFERELGYPVACLPIWITECGFPKQVTDTSPMAPGTLQEQAEHMAGCALAAHRSQIALFMPYSLYQHSSYALLEPETLKPLPAWNAYREQTQLHTPTAPLYTQRQITPCPIVLQWHPLPSDSRSHKTSGTYRFIPSDTEKPLTMQGFIRVYNFSESSISGQLTLETGSLIQIARPTTDPKLDISPQSYKDIPITLVSEAAGYFRQNVRIRFSTEVSLPSRLFFQIESPRRRGDFRRTLLRGSAPSDSGNKKSPAIHYLGDAKDSRITSRIGPWLGINGIRVTRPQYHPLARRSLLLSIPWNFNLIEKPEFPRRPPTAITRIKGLSDDGFFRLSTPHIMEHGYAARIDLIDKTGRRFSVYEWFGLPRDQLNREVWIHTRDFHPISWGNFAPGTLDLSQIREIQLRFYIHHTGVPIPFQLEFLQPILPSEIDAL